MEERSVNNTELVISIRKLYKAFGTNAVLKGFDLDLNRAENLAVLGKSGSGKSVLIKCIIGLLKPDSGIINVFNESIPEMEQDELDHIRARIGFLFQSNALYDSMTVRENLAFPLRRHWIEKNQAKELELIEEALENVGLAHTLNMMPVELSGGMRKRIALARTLILRPEIILYDEPTTGLDPITGKEISELMVSIQEKYKTSSIIISHDMNCIKITADRITLLTEGIAYATGSYDDLKASDDPVVKQFFD
ncbi:ABC transporter ATP-binding protein [Flavihumibacter sp.]|uniref:ABC transporter ATP-binding protein n=1 Tax=Flavihumibacter sp. TaxID=1913981 RepID=UPI002FC6E312